MHNLRKKTPKFTHTHTHTHTHTKLKALSNNYLIQGKKNDE